MPFDAGKAAQRVLPDIMDRKEFPIPKTAREAVRNGAKLLDAASPRWASRINLLRLCLLDPDDCIVGQLYQQEAVRTGKQFGYVAGLKVLGFGEPRAYRRPPESFGFNIDQPLVTNDALVDAWTEQVSARL